MSALASRLFARGLLGLLAVSTVIFACVFWHIYGAEKLFGDFTIFYQAARHAVAGQLDAIYGVAHLSELLRMDSHDTLAFFLNPPTALFLVYPLGFLSASTALALWTGTQIALLCLALSLSGIRSLFAAPSPQAIPGPLLLGILFTTFSLQNFFFGQAALLCASLFLLAFALRRAHPVLAGIALGIFSFKPQLGIVLPLLLVAEKNWKALGVAALVALGMALLSLMAFGPGLWHDYRETLLILRGFMAKPQPALFALTTSPYAALRNLGLSHMAAFSLQCGLSLSVLALIWPALKRGQESHKLLIVIVATYLISPYSLIYDIPLLALPCALLLRRAEADKADFYELIALMLLLLLPLVAILLQLEHIPYSVVAIGVALGVARRLFRREPTLLE